MANKRPEEILKALDECSKPGFTYCKSCCYYTHPTDRCINVMCADAAVYIREQQSAIQNMTRVGIEQEMDIAGLKQHVAELERMLSHGHC